MRKILALLPIIKDIAIILVCVLILVGSIHKSPYNGGGLYIALPMTSKYFEVERGSIDIGFDGEIKADYDDPLYIKILP